MVTDYRFTIGKFVSPEINHMTTLQRTMLDGLDMFNVNLDVYVDKYTIKMRLIGYLSTKKNPLTAGLTS